jgi:lysyl-tRNA synthetase class 2
MQKNHQTRLRKNLILRSRIIQTVRNFFIDRGYLEVETPSRIPAPAPEAHIDAQESGDWFLQTSPELCMKRLLAAGFTHIFQICKCFRMNERGHLHIPELTMLEWYLADATYLELMEECETLIRFVADSEGPERLIRFQGNKIDLSKPWERLRVSDAFARYAPLPLEQALSEDLFDEMIGLEIEPRLGLEKPVFLYDYPAIHGALARRKPGNPDIAERFELYIGGMELCNGFTELTDPEEQRKRFEEEIQFRKSAGKRIYPMPETFLTDLKFMPDAAGNALGLDRLVMMFADAARIDDVIAFTPEDL